MDYQEKAIVGKIVVPASIADVWEVWTTEEGIRSFFAPDCRIDMHPGGRFEILFDGEAAPGLQGSEGMIVMAVVPRSMLSFTWNSPPHLNEVRNQRTQVVIRFQPVNETQTEVTLVHHGWGTGDQWDQSFAYFDRAWKKAVLPRLKQRFEEGPVNWKK